jgi:hypothetical protein
VELWQNESAFAITVPQALHGGYALSLPVVPEFVVNSIF